jgi:hypothetical protein
MASRTASRPFVADPVAEVPGQSVGDVGTQLGDMALIGAQTPRPRQYLFCCEGSDFGDLQSGEAFGEYRRDGQRR